MTGELPGYAELQTAADRRPAGTSWGLFAEPGRGAPSLIGPEQVQAAAGLVSTGQVIGLDYALDAFDPGMSVRREKPRHVIFSGHPCHRDDYLDGFYTQGTTQVDALRHRRSDLHGFYNGVADEAIEPGRPELGIQVWAEQPIVGRGVLIDIAAHRDAQGRPIDHAAAEPIGFELFSEVIEANRIEVGRGDIVLVRTGWAEWFLGLDVDARRAHAQTKLSTGLRQQVEYPQWAWDHQIALLASDCFAVERLPVVEDSPFLESAPDDKGMMHQEFLAHLGIPLGEMWRFDQLAGALAAAGRHSCLITVKPLDLVGGTGSPANAVAIL